ncbi:MAG: T9SS type A sorting domain-containing protein, partial [Candidatus Marinimicrobia bacterium]|nr:T9SS type A sorting domain-containing protein [Candidatus Neomarinimicrobiota bacterium]
IYVNGYVNSAPLSGSYKLSWPRMQDLHSEWTLTLEDLETGAQIDMAVHEYYEFDVNRLGKKSLLPISPPRNLTGSVPFQLMKKSDEDGPRFLLRIDPGNAFPEILKDFTLGQNYPNPFNEGTIIPFSIPLEGRVSAKIYDVRGRLVDQLVESKFYFAGQHNLNWLATGRSSGIYFCQMQIDDKYFTKKMILLR